MMSTDSRCPPAGVLEQLLRGELPDEAGETLAEHLNACGQCLGTVQNLHAQDPLSQALCDPAVKVAPPDAIAQDGVLRASKTCDAVALLAEPLQDDELGRLGPYRVLKVLGVGGMGAVFLAEDAKLQRLVAVKALLPALAAKPSARDRFLREARAAAKVKHERVVAIHDIDDKHNPPYFVMEHLDGESLDGRLKREGRLPPAEALRIAREIAEGLAAAHARGLIHRDVKPSNIWLETRPGEAKGRVKVLDFGLVLPKDGSAHLTETGLVLGTPAFMAPEQARGEEVDPRCDLFSLGCVLYQMCTGELPFKGENPVAVLMAVGAGRVKPPREANPAVSPALSKLVMRLTAPNPADRPASAEAVVASIAALERPAGRPRRPWLFAAAAAVVLLALIPLAWFYGTSRIAIPATGGVVVIETDDGAVEVTVKGQSATIVDPRTRREIVVTPGDVEIEVKEKNGLHLFTKAFTLSRDGKEIVNVHQELAQAKPPDKIPQPGAKGAMDRLDPADIPAGERFDWLPKDVVAVLGDPRSGGGDIHYLRSVAFSPDGNRVLAACGDGRARVWEAATGRETAALPGRPGEGLLTAAFSPDGSRVLSAGTHQPVWLFDVDRRKEVQHFGPNEVVFHVAFDPADGRRALVSHRDRSDGPGTIRLWDVEAGKELHSYSGHSAYAYGAAFSPDGRRFVSGGADKTIRLWDVEKVVELRRYERKPNQVICVAFSPDGRHVVAGETHGLVSLFDLDTDGPAPAAEFEGHKEGGQVTSVAFSPDGKVLASAADDGRIVLWETAARRKLCEWQVPKPVYLIDVAFAPDGHHLAATTPAGVVLLFRLPPEGMKREDGRKGVQP